MLGMRAMVGAMMIAVMTVVEQEVGGGIRAVEGAVAQAAMRAALWAQVTVALGRGCTGGGRVVGGCQCADGYEGDGGGYGCDGGG